MEHPRMIFPGEGLIKTTPAQPAKLDGAQKAALIRKGNELFNTGNIEQAKRVFLTTGYTDGLIRVGDYYQRQQRFLQALQMYIVAPEPRKREQLVEKMSKVVRHWLSEENSPHTPPE